MKLLSRIEEIILLSIWRLQDDAYGISIHSEVIRMSGKKWLLGAIYTPLARLQRNGLISSAKGEPTSERGGRAKVYYKLTPKGRQALRAVEKINSIIWADIGRLSLERE